jgi:2-phospho-L-lactate guanylyltransferase
MVIVPVKPLAESKSRLATVLDPTGRVELTRRLLERTLLKLARARGLARVVVISRDEAVLKLARKHGAWSILESGGALGEALDQAARVCVANGATALLVLPADLPRLRVRDVEKIIALGEPAPRVVLVPAERDGGTNALLQNPSGIIPFHFGEHSAERHRAAARAAGIPLQIYDSNTVTMDLDLPEDFARLNLKFSPSRTESR